ncbi:mitochondrial assembly of ribosomal large subunit protein 1 [Varanus komodoensis]|uniref:Mitochondrial assembly of ribosomal large subunit protein 1 n=1 Tax=Varanus komodoensis TaxID=61221 RepID=A0A8D2L9X6_VARKO|nr:mitochondrial assembly of ribosomal large subunit protein 1 [Varanus komodoensis]
MWRGSRCLRTLLAVKSWGAEAAGVPRRAWKLGKAGHREAAAAIPRVPCRSASLVLRRLSSEGISELRDERGAAGEEQQDGQGAGGAGSGFPSELLPSVFSIDQMVSLLRQEHAQDICVIQLPPEMKYSNYFIIVSGTSTRHLHAMAFYLVKMHKHLKTDSDPHVILEGKDSDNWLCIDFGNIVIHFMLPETREIYELEKLWTLRSYDDQLAQMLPESLPEDFILGLTSEQQ